MAKLNWSMKACGIFLLWVMTAIALPAQTFTTLHSFDGTHGQNPFAGLVQGTNGKFYGTTTAGGTMNMNDGTVFSITTGGTLTTLHSFDGTDGLYPYAGLVQGTNGKFYGMTNDDGGANGYGTVFSITASGALTTLSTFDFTDGAHPYAALVQGTNGKFYGITQSGGTMNSGTVFSITAGGTLATLYNFCSQGGANCTDGAYPVTGLVQGTNGKFYGTTYGGGANGDGTVFSITAGGMLTTLHSFDGTDGQDPWAGLVQGTNGKFYGTTYVGGTKGDGTVFSITAGGTLATLHSFGGTDGQNPYAGLVQGTDGNFYGTTFGGGANGDGTLFSITAGGTLATLHSFDGTDGGGPYGAGLVQGTNGTFYGTTYFGGSSDDGTVFSLSVGLGPFVATNPQPPRWERPSRFWEPV